MTTNYDEGHIAEQYKQAKEQPWRSRIETYSLLKLIGDIRGKKVVDVACGEGYFTRKLRRLGAAEVVGFDVSERMIELAQAQEASDPLGIEYRVADARAVAPSQDFDLAVSAWLLVYAHDRAELASMCEGLACWLRPGGRFVTLTTNPDMYFFDRLPDYGKYGFQMKLADRVFEGAPITWNINLDGPDLEIENYYLPVAAYESAFENAGFREFKVRQIELGPNPQGADDSEYWKDFLDYPTAILIDCIKT